MARGKDPKGTLNRILDVAEQLFAEKGYEHTSIQDIIDGLGGLSKGAIYHHFKSKGEIFMAVNDRVNAAHYAVFDQIAADDSMTGLEKLNAIFRVSAGWWSDRDPVLHAVLNVMDDPHLLTCAVRNVIHDITPNYILPLIEEGVADGSIESDYPNQLAEFLTLTVNLWLNPMVYGGDPALAEGRIRFFDDLLKGVGISIIDEDIIRNYVKFCDVMAKARAASGRTE